MAILVGIIKDIVLTAAACLGAYVALHGLSTWQRQMKSHSQYELARRLLRAAYRVRDNLQAVRAPLILPGEVEHARKQIGLMTEGFSPKEAMQIGIRAAYHARWKAVQESLSDFRVARNEAEALWGPTIILTLKPLEDVAHKLWATIVIHLEFQERGIRENPAELMMRGKILGKLSDDPAGDEYAQKLTSVLGQIEAVARKHL